MIASIASALLKAIATVGTVIGKAYKIASVPARIAGSIALKAGASAKSAKIVTDIAKLSTAIAADRLTGNIINKMPESIGKPIQTVNRMLIIKNIL